MTKPLALGLGLVGLVLCGGALALHRSQTSVVLNVGDSLPHLLFLCTPYHEGEGVPVGLFVQFTPPARVTVTMQQVAPGVTTALPWVKQVAATGGTTVCWEDGALYLPGHPPAPLGLVGRYPLTPPAGCLTLAVQELMLLGSHPQSFDSRYVGPLTRQELTAVCQPLWPWKGRS